MFETDRLTVRRFGIGDAGFVLAMLNDPGFLANIGDRGVRTIGAAEDYVRDRILASYERNGFGMYRVALKAGGVPVGMVGLVRRIGLDGPDLGFALLADHVGRGYGFEAGAAMIAHARERLGIDTLLAITALENAASARLLIKLGFHETGMKLVPGYDDPSRLFVRDTGSSVTNGLM